MPEFTHLALRNLGVTPPCPGRREAGKVAARTGRAPLENVHDRQPGAGTGRGRDAHRLRDGAELHAETAEPAISGFGETAIEDCTQDALVRLVLASRAKPIENLEALMTTIASHIGKDFPRGRLRWAVIMKAMPDDPIDVTAPETCNADFPGEPLGRLRFCALQFFRSRNAGSLDLAISFFSGLDWPAVAARVGRSDKAIRKQWSRCASALREFMADEKGVVFEWIGERA